MFRRRGRAGRSSYRRGFRHGHRAGRRRRGAGGRGIRVGYRM